ncbi:MAG: hypothetical protein ABIA04_04850 [Pseudomonadota bacterium]
MKKIIILICFFFLFLFIFSFAQNNQVGEVGNEKIDPKINISDFEGYKQYISAIHVQSSYSSGEDSIPTIAKRAYDKGISIVMMTDTLIKEVFYGFPPFRNVLGVSVSESSILKNGPAEYLKIIEKVNDDYYDKGLIMIPGCEASPFHYWEGSVFKGDLTIKDWRRHLHVVGLYKPWQYKQLPVVHGGWTKRNIRKYMFVFLMFSLAIILGIVLIMKKGYIRYIGIIIAIFGLMGTINNFPLRSSKYNPYYGSYQHSPYQHFINKANTFGGMVFYAHPESNKEEEEISGRGFLSFLKLKMKTAKYPNLLVKTRDYAGFEGAYSRSAKAIYAGNQWDKVLGEYLNRVRDLAPWTISGGDYHGLKPEGGWGNIESGQTILLLKNFELTEIFAAMWEGRMYSVRNGKQASENGYLIMPKFYLENSEETQKAISGQELVTSKLVNLNINLKTTLDKAVELKLMIIKNGELIKEEKIKTPYELVITDDVSAEFKGYYRIIAEGSSYQLVSNPIFYRVNKESKRY